MLLQVCALPCIVQRHANQESPPFAHLDHSFMLFCQRFQHDYVDHMCACQCTKIFCMLTGSARVKDCLEQHRLEDDFSSECREELEGMMKERATDFRLDSSLRDACEDDIMYTCGWDDVSARL